MRIEDEIKLTFDDVLIRPKRSTLVSRSEVVLERQFKFRHTNETWTGVPIFSANMDTTGTFETAITLQKHKMLTAIHKFYMKVGTYIAKKSRTRQINFQNVTNDGTYSTIEYQRWYISQKRW